MEIINYILTHRTSAQLIRRVVRRVLVLCCDGLVQEAQEHGTVILGHGFIQLAMEFAFLLCKTGKELEIANT